MAEGDLEYILTGLPGTEGAAISDFCYHGYKQKICEKIRKTHYADKKFLFTIPPEKCIIIHK